MIDHFNGSDKDLKVNSKDLKDLGIINQTAFQQLENENNSTVYHSNKKFMQVSSNLWKGHHKNDDPYRRILSASMKVVDQDNNDKQLKLWQDESKWGPKVWDSGEYLWWDIVNVLDFTSSTESVMAYASAQYPSELPNALQRGTNYAPSLQSIRDILSINTNKWTTIDVNEGWARSTTKTNTYSTSIDVEFGYDLPLVGDSKITVGFGYERSRAMETTKNHQVNTEIAFFAPNIQIPGGYSFRLHPVMGYDITTIEYDLKAKTTGQIRTFNRTKRNRSSNYARTDAKLGYLPGFKDVWDDGWDSGVQYPSTNQPEYAYASKAFEVYDLNDAVDATTGIEVYLGNYNDESKILLRENVPNKTNIDRYFRHANDQLAAGQTITYTDVKRLGVLGANGELKFRFHNDPQPYDNVGVRYMYVGFYDVNNNFAYWRIADPAIATDHIIKLSDAQYMQAGFSLNQVKKMRFYSTKTSGNYEFSAFLN